MSASHINAPHFQDADKAREYLERQRWANGVICPHCGTIGDHHKLEGKAHRPGVYKCHGCREQFTVTVGTVFERSKIALNIWLQAVYFICSSKKGISSHQLHRTLGVTYKTAWFMTHRIREALANNGAGGLLGGSGGVVEADETYWGTTPRSKKAIAIRKSGGKVSGGDKQKIVSLVERGGDVRCGLLRRHLYNDWLQRALRGCWWEKPLNNAQSNRDSNERHNYFVRRFFNLNTHITQPFLKVFFSR